MSVLVIGASGPLGRAVVHELSRAGHDVTGVSRSGGAGSSRADVTDDLQATGLLDGARPRAVVYLARPDLGDDPGGSGAIESETQSLSRFAERCSAAGVSRFVFASSAAVYGTGYSRPVHEADALDDGSAYAALKIRSEVALGRFESLSVIALRVFNVYGPGFRDSLVNRLAHGSDPVVYDSEHYVRDYVHSSDVARAFTLAVEDPDAGSHTLNVGSGTGLDNPSLLRLFPGAAHRRHADTDVVSYSVADISSIHSRWAFAPRVSVADAAVYPEYLR